MKKDNIKQALISLCIGIAVTFFSTLFTEIAAFLKTHSTEIISGVASSGVYLAKAYKG